MVGRSAGSSVCERSTAKQLNEGTKEEQEQEGNSVARVRRFESSLLRRTV
jgi:hypothetical protein